MTFLYLKLDFYFSDNSPVHRSGYMGVAAFCHAVRSYPYDYTSLRKLPRYRTEAGNHSRTKCFKGKNIIEHVQSPKIGKTNLLLKCTQINPSVIVLQFSTCRYMQ